MNIWQEYVRHIAGDVTGQTIADRTGISQSTASRWLRNVKPPTEAAKVAAFAQGYNRSVLEAFVAAGMLSLAEAQAGLSNESVQTLQRLERGEPFLDYTLTVIDNQGEHVVVRLTDGRTVELRMIEGASGELSEADANLLAVALNVTPGDEAAGGSEQRGL